MSSNPNSVYRFAGGSLNPEDPTYVERQADTDLFELLKAGSFCYVLNSRQMGKSSLRKRTRLKLETEAGFICSEIDLSGIERRVDQAAWYAGIAWRMIKSFQLDGVNWKVWQHWTKENTELGTGQQLSHFIEEVILPSTTQDIVIFIDEIDSVLGIDENFTDDLFGLIRDWADRTQETRNQVTFCLLGVASPNTLLKDHNFTPFNLGQAIDLKGFSLEEAQLPLSLGLVDKLDKPSLVLEEILGWTGGQPFLTQKLCHLAIQKSTNGMVDVEQLVQNHIIENWEAQDKPQHLKTIRERVLSQPQFVTRILGLYQQVLNEEQISEDGSPEVMELRLSSLVIEDRGILKTHNRIYEAIFNQDWIQSQLDALRPYAVSINSWKNSEYSEEIFLLKGHDLDQAKAWSQGKSLSDLDYEYLAACDALEKREIQQVNQLLAEANSKAKHRIRTGSGVLATTLTIAAVTGGFSIWAANNLSTVTKQVNVARSSLADAKEDLTAASKALVNVKNERDSAKEETNKANKELGSVIKNLGTTKAEERKSRREAKVAKGLASEAKIQQNQAESATQQARTDKNIATKAKIRAQKATLLSQRGSELERRGNNILRYSSDQFREIEVLRQAVQLGYELKQLIKEAEKPVPTDILTLEGYPAISPVLVLRAALNIIWEENRLRGKFEGYSSDRKLILTYSYRTKNSYLYNSSGNIIGIFKGNWPSISPNNQRVVTSLSKGVSALYSSSGEKIAQIPGSFQRFSRNGNFFVTSSASTYIFDSSGNLIKEFKNFAIISPDEKFAMINSENRENSLIFDLLTKKTVKIKGDWNSISQNSKYIVTRSRDKKVSYLYDTNGKLITKIPVQPVYFIPNGEELYHKNDKNKSSMIFNLAGVQIAKLPTYIREFSLNGKYFAAESKDGALTYLYKSSGKLVAKLVGRFNSFFSRKNFISTTLHQDDRLIGCHIYDLNGKLYAEFPGKCGGRIPKYRKGEKGSISLINGKNLVISTLQYGESNLKTKNYLYSVSGQEISQFSDSLFQGNSDDGQILIFGNTLYNWLGQPLGNIKGDFKGFIDKGLRLVTSSRNEDTTHIYNFSNNLLSSVATVPNKEPLFPLTFTPNSQGVITTSNHIFDEENISYHYDLFNSKVSQIKGQFNRNNFSSNGKLFVTRSRSYDFSYIYSLSGDLIKKLEGFFSYYDSKKHLITSVTDKQKKLQSNIYDQSGNLVDQISEKRLIYSSINNWHLAESKDEKSIFMIKNDGKILGKFKGKLANINEKSKRLVTHFQNSKKLEDRSIIYLYDFTGKLIAKLKGEKNSLLLNPPEIKFSLTGQRFIYSSLNDFNTDLYDTSGKKLAKFPTWRTYFSPDGQKLLTSPDTDTTLLHDFNGRLLAQLDGVFYQFSPDGKFFATVMDANNKSIIYGLNGRKMFELKGSFGDFSKNSQRIITYSIDENISYMYDYSGRLVAQFVGSGTLYNIPELSPDGQHVLLYSGSNRFHIWPLDNGLDDLLKQGCDRLKKYFYVFPEKHLNFCQE